MSRRQRIAILTEARIAATFEAHDRARYLFSLVGYSYNDPRTRTRTQPTFN